jgi:hypothetical protein
MRLFWLSFSGGTKNGIAIIEAEDFLSAVFISHVRDCNPGGEIAGFEMTPEALDAIPADEMALVVTLPRHQLLTLDDCKAHGLNMSRWKDGAEL